MAPKARSARTHIYAWYTYAFAAEVFSACALAIFLPITLEQMAREVGYVAPDLTVPCTQMGAAEGDEAWVCKARILGSWVDTASFSMYVKSLAVAIQALAIISIGPLADSREGCSMGGRTGLIPARWRKKLLIIFAYAGALSGIALLLFPARSATWIPVATAGITIIGNVGYATSVVCSNAFLPGLAREDPDVAAAADPASIRSTHGSGADGGAEGHTGRTGTGDEETGESRLDTATEGEGETLLPRALAPAITSISAADLARADPDVDGYARSDENHYQALLSLTTSRISSTGTGLGFFSGVAVLALLTVPVTLGHGSTASLRLAIGLSGLWWAVFTIPPAFGLPSGDVAEEMTRSAPGAGRFLATAWRRVGRMIAPREMKRLPNLFTLLLAWIFLSDGFHTTTYTAILYASTTLRMPPSKIIVIGILVQLAAVVSSIYTPRLQRRLGHANIAVLLRIVMLALILPVYTCIGLVLPFGGLRTEGEMYVAATWFGLLYGPFNSYSRAVYAELIPPGHESSFFSLFALTDKSASFLGPFVVGVIADITGNIRLGFLFLLAMLLIPVPVLLRVNIPRGREEAKLWSRT